MFEVPIKGTIEIDKKMYGLVDIFNKDETVENNNGKKRGRPPKEEPTTQSQTFGHIKKHWGVRRILKTGRETRMNTSQDEMSTLSLLIIDLNTGEVTGVILEIQDCEKDEKTEKNGKDFRQNDTLSNSS